MATNTSKTSKEEAKRRAEATVTSSEVSMAALMELLETALAAKFKAAI